MSVFTSSSSHIPSNAGYIGAFTPNLWRVPILPRTPGLFLRLLLSLIRSPRMPVIFPGAGHASLVWLAVALCKRCDGAQPTSHSWGHAGANFPRSPPPSSLFLLLPRTCWRVGGFSFPRAAVHLQRDHEAEDCELREKKGPFPT